jgi:hypothetical protein
MSRFTPHPELPNDWQLATKRARKMRALTPKEAWDLLMDISLHFQPPHGLDSKLCSDAG